MAALFKFHGHCEYVRASSGSCIYNILTGDIIDLNEDYDDALAGYDFVHEYAPIDGRNTRLIDDLINANLGFRASSNVVVDPTDLSMSPMYRDALAPNNSISTLFLELTNECNLDCCFCSQSDPVNRATGCKRFRLGERRLDLLDYRSIIEQARKLKATKVVAIGGEPFLAQDLLKGIIDSCSTYHLTLTVYTNGTLSANEELARLAASNDVEFKVQILFDNDLDYHKTTRAASAWARIQANLSIWKQMGIKLSALVLIGKFNEAGNNLPLGALQDHGIPISLQYIMPYPPNEFCSQRLAPAILDRKSQLSRISMLCYHLDKRRHPCLGHVLAVAADGRIYPCPSMRGHELGRTDNTMLHEALLAPDYVALSQVSKSKVEGCRDCKYRYGCSDCRAVEYAATGRIDGMKNCNRCV